ncbi:BA14K family protein [Methylobacterium sp. J-078]|nr:BA14K family protein [Methylobacterium sp. J-078]MCJ2043686.1 BA14K family protein [Methylobacterium sp. J-078]
MTLTLVLTAACARRVRSSDAASGAYPGCDGDRHPCL